MLALLSKKTEYTIRYNGDVYQVTVGSDGFEYLRQYTATGTWTVLDYDADADRRTMQVLKQFVYATEKLFSLVSTERFLIACHKKN